MTGTIIVAIIYYSATGHTSEIAGAMADELDTDPQVRVLLRRVAELAPQQAIDANPAWAAHRDATSGVAVATADDLVAADAVILGSPTRFGNVSAQLKQFLDTLGPQWQAGLLADKVYSGFTSTGTAHGGHESTLLALTHTFHHFGGIVVAPGYTDPVKFADGNPYGTSHHDAGGTTAVDDTTRRAARYQARRVLSVTRAIHAGRVGAAAG